MRIRTCSVLLLVSLLAACHRGPSREEALAALRASDRNLDTAVVFGRVWQDGPPWFSCAEVINKLDGRADRTTVRDQVGNWKTLVVSGWIVLRDSSHGVVSEPGWCTAKLTDDGQRQAALWTAASGPAFPTGVDRRGWTMPLGRRAVAVLGKTHAVGSDSATASYIVTLRPNANGVATGAAKDTARFVAAFRRADGEWRVTGSWRGR